MQPDDSWFKKRRLLMIAIAGVSGGVASFVALHVQTYLYEHRIITSTVPSVLFTCFLIGTIMLALLTIAHRSRFIR